MLEGSLCAYGWKNSRKSWEEKISVFVQQDVQMVDTIVFSQLQMGSGFTAVPSFRRQGAQSSQAAWQFRRPHQGSAERRPLTGCPAGQVRDSRHRARVHNPRHLEESGSCFDSGVCTSALRLAAGKTTVPAWRTTGASFISRTRPGVARFRHPVLLPGNPGAGRCIWLSDKRGLCD